MLLIEYEATHIHFPTKTIASNETTFFSRLGKANKDSLLPFPIMPFFRPKTAINKDIGWRRNIYVCGLEFKGSEDSRSLSRSGNGTRLPSSFQERKTVEISGDFRDNPGVQFRPFEDTMADRLEIRLYSLLLF